MNGCKECTKKRVNFNEKSCKEWEENIIIDKRMLDWFILWIVQNIMREFIKIILLYCDDCRQRDYEIIVNHLHFYDIVFKDGMKSVVIIMLWCIGAYTIHGQTYGWIESIAWEARVCIRMQLNDCCID